MNPTIFKKLDKTYPYSLAEDVTGLKLLFVNVYFIGRPGDGNPWMLVDAGMQGSGNRIRKEAEYLFGKNNPPLCIVLTHGHFDHTGGLSELLKHWPETRIYAHPQEIPYLTGKSSYPYPDPNAGDGAMAYMSWMFPIKPVHLGEKVFPVAVKVSELEFVDWHLISTPGHSPGHLSLYREKDGVLIAGDAFTTTNQNSLSSVLTQKMEIHGPPAYFTINWEVAKTSLEKLSQLKLHAAGTGHGPPVFGNDLVIGLQQLLTRFDQEEMPREGHYVQHPVDLKEMEKDWAKPSSFQNATNLSKFAAFTLIGLGLIGLVRKMIK